MFAYFFILDWDSYPKTSLAIQKGRSWSYADAVIYFPVELQPWQHIVLSYSLGTEADL